MTARLLNGVRKAVAVGAVVATILAMGACGASKDRTSDGKVKWRHGLVHPGAEAGFLQMARDKKLFEKYGVEVEYVEFSSAAQFFPALLSGEIDSIEGSPGALFPLVQKGQDLRVVGSTMPGLPWALYSRKEIKSVQDLKGKSLAISAKHALPDQVARAMLSKSGVNPDDIKYVNAGGNPDRYKAVLTGTVDVASAPADYVPRAEKDGLNVLALSTDIVPDFPRFTVTARGQSLKDRPEGMAGFLAGMSEGIQYAMAHPEEAKALAAKVLKTTPDDPAVQYVTDLTIKEKLVSPDVRPPREKLEFLQNVMIEQGELKGPVDLDELIDDSFQKKALELVKQKGGS